MTPQTSNAADRTDRFEEMKQEAPVIRVARLWREAKLPALLTRKTVQLGHIGKGDNA
jgi:hypothetical protein